MIAHSILIAALLSSLASHSTEIVHFDPPIDALSIELSSPDDRRNVRGWDGQEWTPWFPLAVEEEFDPLLKESNLVIFPQPVSRIELRGGNVLALHPIRVPKDPVRTLLAARISPPKHRILSREEWGADDTFLFAGGETQRSDTTPERTADTIENGNGIIPERLRECEEWQRRYPEEFHSARELLENANGQRYRWSLQYSPSVKLLVVHHTAQNVTGDQRPALERVRALYAYHANSRGWGDIGYHYLIDEAGQIYEGRVGGRGVIGGHAYCWNTGTISIVLLGNFDIEQPPQMQMQNLQWLLSDLAETYGLDLGSSVRMHGKNLPVIVGHRDLLSTDCPGYYVRETLAQVRENVWKKNLLATIRFPRPISLRRSVPAPSLRTAALLPHDASPSLSALGITQLQGRPGGVLPLSLQYRNGKSALPQYTTIAEVEADPGIYLWQKRGKRFVPVRGQLQIPASLPAEESTTLRLKVQFPTSPGEFHLQIGQIRYTLLVAGKRAKASHVPSAAPLPRMINPQSPIPNEFPLAKSKITNVPIIPATSNEQPVNGKIRIRLTFTEDTAIILLPDDALVNGIHPAGREILLFRDTENCTAKERGKNIASGIIRINGGSPFAITDGRNLRRYNGTLECRVIDGSLTLINELSLENYLLGLAEEPDTEPFEKQKAFAIAARSYAAHYLGDTYRKFPNMPYDGSDSAALFQAYEGLTFAERNPAWVRAVRETAGKILTKESSVLRAAYFSSDDGQTRSPEEAGWSNFPHTEVFTSKPDPWCKGKPNAGHGVGMSGCGARGQAEEGKSAEEILRYYYPGTSIEELTPSP